MRKTRLAATTVLAAMAASFTVLAGTWKSDANGWWYDEGNGSYPKNTWSWIDGNNDGVSECYYFDPNGYCLINTVTPDNYYVNPSGAWVVNGVVQTRTADISQQAVKEDRDGRYCVGDHKYIIDFSADEKAGVDYLQADNNSVKIKGYFRKDSQYIGYHDKTFQFSDNCTFWDGNENETYSKSEFIRNLNGYYGLDFCFTVENGVIVRAELWS